MALEQQYQKKIAKYLESRGAYVVVIYKAKKGVPDILACYKGKFIAIEVKTPTTRANTTKLQENNLSRILVAGGISGVAVYVEDVARMLEELVDD